MGCPSPGPGRCLGDLCPAWPCGYEPQEAFCDDVNMPETIPERAKTVISLNIYFESRISPEEVAQVINELDERLRDLPVVLSDLFEEDYLGNSISIEAR